MREAKIRGRLIETETNAAPTRTPVRRRHLPPADRPLPLGGGGSKAVAKAFGFFAPVEVGAAVSPSSSGPLLADASLAAAVAPEGEPGLLPTGLGRENRFLVAHWGIFTVLVVAAGMVIAAGGDEQKLVQFYAVSVFAAFLAATLGCARMCHQDGRRASMLLNLFGAALVLLVLVLNLTRLDSVIALLASGAVAFYLWRAWVARGRPAGIVDY